MSVGSKVAAVGRADVYALLEEYNCKNVRELDDAALVKKLMKLPSVVEGDNRPDSKRLCRVLDEILEMIEAGCALSIEAAPKEVVEESQKPTILKMPKVRKEKVSDKPAKEVPSVKPSKAVPSPKPQGPKVIDPKSRFSKPGIEEFILKLLKKASAKKPVNKEQIWEAMKARFPERNAMGMFRTVNSFVPSGCFIKGKGDVQKSDRGFWIEE